MTSGKLDRRLRFERRAAAATDGEGNYEGAWATICTRAASVLPRRTGNSEIVLAGRLEGRVFWSIEVRSDSETRTIDEACRAVDTRNAALVFNIRSVVDLEGRSALLTMDAETGVGT